MPLLPKPKRVLLLAVSCKKGGLCPGGVDLDNPSQWIRIVRDDGYAGSVQSFEIDYAQPLDVIEFTGHPVPRGVQKENWAIDFNSCRKVHTYPESIMKSVYEKYGYHGFWKNSRAYLDEYEMDVVDQESIPSESLLHVRNVFIYKNPSGKAKLDFDWGRLKLKGISMTDPDYYDPLNAGNEVRISEAIIVISIPYAADFTFPGCSSGRGYKFVSKIFDCDGIAGEQKQPEPKYEYLEKGIPFGVMPEKQPQHPQPSSNPWQSEHSDVGSSTVNSISDKAVANQQQQQPKSHQQQNERLTQPISFTKMLQEAEPLAKHSLNKSQPEQTTPTEDVAPKAKLQTQQQQISSFMERWERRFRAAEPTVTLVTDTNVISRPLQAANDKPIEQSSQQQQPASAKPIKQSAQQQQPQPKPQQQQDDRLTQPIRYTKMLQEAKRKEAAQLAKQSLSKAPQEQTTPKKDFAPKVKLQTQQKPRSTFWAGILKIFGLK